MRDNPRNIFTNPFTKREKGTGEANQWPSLLHHFCEVLVSSQFGDKITTPKSILWTGKETPNVDLKCSIWCQYAVKCTQPYPCRLLRRMRWVLTTLRSHRVVYANLWKWKKVVKIKRKSKIKNIFWNQFKFMFISSSSSCLITLLCRSAKTFLVGEDYP